MNEEILAKVYFHDIPEENDYDVHDEKHMSGDCDGCVPAYIVTRSSFDTLKEDRDHQYDMKVKAREQRDAATEKLKAAEAEILRYSYILKGSVQAV